MQATRDRAAGDRRAGYPARADPRAARARTGAGVVRVEATGVSFAEQQMRRGKYYDQPPFPFVPGYDLVGVVDGGRPGGASPR